VQYAAANIRNDVRLAAPAARVLALDVHDVGVIEDSHLRCQAGPARELAHRRAADLAHRELVQVRVAELRDAEVEAPAVAFRGRRNEPSALEHLEQIRHARARRAEPLGELAGRQAVLAALDEKHEKVESPSRGASNRPSLSHEPDNSTGARRISVRVDGIPSQEQHPQIVSGRW